MASGTTYKVHGGNAYRVEPRTHRWEFVQRVYDPAFRATHYVERDGTIFRKSDDGTLVPVRRRFTDGFENADRLADLIGPQRGWTSCSLQSPRARSVPEYVALRKRILKEGADFLDNRLEPSGSIAHGGTTALASFSMPLVRGMITAKASLSTELLHFVQGDHVWISLWCLVPAHGGMPFAVLDLETTCSTWTTWRSPPHRSPSEETLAGHPDSAVCRRCGGLSPQRTVSAGGGT